MEFVQKQVRYMGEGKRIFDQFSVDEDYHVPEEKPEVGRVIYTLSALKTGEFRLAENDLCISGKLCFQILYMATDGEAVPVVLEGEIPFEETVYVENTEMEKYFIDNARVEFTTAIIHTRKLSIKATVELEIDGKPIREEETTVDVASHLPVYKKKRKVHLLELHTTKRDTCRIREEITLPGTKESIERTLLTHICGRKLEIRPKQGALQLQGELLVFCLYLSGEGKPDWLEQTVSYEGKVACDGMNESMYYHVQSVLEDTSAEVRRDEDGEMRVLGIEGTLVLQMGLYQEEELELLEDMYSLEQNCVFDTRQAEYEELFMQNHSKCKVAEKLSLPELTEDVLQICHSDGSVQIEHMEQTEKGFQVEGILHVSFLYRQANEGVPFGSWQGMTPFSQLLECPGLTKEARCDVTCRVEQLFVSPAGSETVEIKAVLAFDEFIRQPVKMQVITGAELVPMSEEETEQKAGIIGYIVKEGDALWDLAKRYMTTEEGIREINHLESSGLKPGDKLLIFKENRISG